MIQIAPVVRYGCCIMNASFKRKIVTTIMTDADLGEICSKDLPLLKMNFRKKKKLIKAKEF